MFTLDIWQVLVEDLGGTPGVYAFCVFLSLFTIPLDILVSPFEIIGLLIWFIHNHFLK